MAPTPNLPATSKKRQSCDRCHGQKLRCIRAGSRETDACNRCLRQGAHCVYSSSLPKGRPNIYRLADGSTAPSNPSATTTTPVIPELQRRTHSGPYTPGAEANHHKSNMSGNEDPMIMDTFSSSTTWPCLDPINWNDMQMDGSEQDSSHWASTLHPMVVDRYTHPSPSFLDPFPNFLNWVSPTTSEADGSVRGGPSSPNRPQDYGHALGSDIFDNSSNRSSSSSNSSSSSSISSSSNSSIIASNIGPQAGIARLSQLSTRLYPLHRSSLTLAETAGSSNQPGDRKETSPRPLLDKAAFRSVAGWLVHVSSNMTLASGTGRRKQSLEAITTGDTLHDAFSASHQLLEILRCLQADAVTSLSAPSISASTSSNAAGAQIDNNWACNTITPQSSSNPDKPEQQRHQQQQPHNKEPFNPPSSSSSSSSSPPPPSSYTRSSNTVIHHLVHACHTLLLDIYVAFLIALQDDAERWSSSSSCRPAGAAVIDAAAAAALADIPLVLTVQLCSYLIERQHQAVDRFLSLSQQQQQNENSRGSGSGSRQPSPPPAATTNREVTSDLETEVQQRLGRLRQTLRI
ncbi:MAG: hypothetical protein L6R35_005942 [Caloplaca aegaea]|nr:MAG: hypothetical protein L6R35_005942 [Caloplaca aegaea]